MKLIPTFNDIPAETRSKMADCMNECVADSLDLYTHAKQAHWNVRGLDFLSIHEFFDTIAEKASGFTDLLAERAGQLGGGVNGTLQMAAAATTLPKYELIIDEVEAHVEQLSKSMSAYNKKLRGKIDVADEAGDAITTDLLTGIVRESDKLLWFLESHLELASRRKGAKA